MRTYSAEVKHDDDGTLFYGVYQGSRFIMLCSSMAVAAEVAEKLSIEYNHGLENGDVGRTIESHDISTMIKKVNDVEEPYHLLLPIQPEPPEPPPMRVYQEGITLSEGAVKGSGKDIISPSFIIVGAVVGLLLAMILFM